MSEITIILPTLNEGKNAGRLIKKILSIRKNAQIIVSDDGSRDGTRQAVSSLKSKNVLFLDRSKKKTHGLTASVLDAILRTKTPHFIVMDADFQHPVETIRELQKALETGADMAIACRKKRGDGFPPHRLLISTGAEALAKTRLLLAGKQAPEDLMSGFFGMRTSLARTLALKYKFQLGGYKLMFEFLKHMPKDAEISCVPYEFDERRSGSSKFGPAHALYFIRSLA